MKLRYIIFALSLCPMVIHGFKLDRVILATDNHPNYIQFWPVVAQAWSDIVGITPILALIADDSVKIDETRGDVIRFAPIEGVKTSLHAQTIRLLLPTMFPDEICILSDIDIIPLSKEYFVDSVKEFADDTFIVYQNLEYDPRGNRWPMCYCAAKGSTFREIFQVYSMKKIHELIIEWSNLNFKWDTDELMLFKHVSSWKK